MKNCELRKKHLPVAFILWLLLTILIVNTASAQDNFTITNYFSPQYHDFQMMKISLVPPAGFEKDTEVIGFIDSKNGAAIRAEMIKQSIKQTSDYFFTHFDSTTHKDSLGMKIIESFDFKINDFQSHLVHMTAKVEGDDYTEWRLFIGDTVSSYLIRGYMPANGKTTLEQRIRTSLLTTFYEPDRRLIPAGTDPTTTSSTSCSCHLKKQ